MSPFHAAPRVAGQQIRGIELFQIGLTGVTAVHIATDPNVSILGVINLAVVLPVGLYLLWEHFIEGNQLPGGQACCGQDVILGLQLLALGLFGTGIYCRLV